MIKFIKENAFDVGVGVLTPFLGVFILAVIAL